MTSASVYEGIRNVLELLYFVAGIALVVVAVKGLAQIKIALQQLEITKQIAQATAKRDAYKLAQQQSQEYGTVIMVRIADQLQKMRAAGVTLWDRPSRFKVENGEIVSHNFGVHAIGQAMQTSDPTLFLNALEGFAMFFVTGMADEEIGYRETAISFCRIAEKFMSGFWYYRETKGAMYKSVIELYEMWQGRLQVEDLRKAQQQIESTLKNVKTKSVPTMGTD